jgi:hypothetical protein
MKSTTVETSMNAGSPLKSRRLLLLLATLLLGGGSPCMVVSSFQTASGAASISATRNLGYTQYCNPAVARNASRANGIF